MSESVGKYVCEVTVVDPDTGLNVDLIVYKDGLTGGMFAVDACYVVQEEPEKVRSPFNDDGVICLMGD